VLYVSGYAEQIVVSRGVVAPGVSLLQKPFAPEALAQRVRDVLDG
jgi:two-component system, cell cycle sensor histidine kinase and response regulator CckA